MDSSIHISSHVDACGRGFLSLAEALTNASRYADQIRPEVLRDEFDRFKIWAGNIAAHRKGRRSLDYRLRDAGHLKAETHNLLTALQDSLENALAIVNGEKIPWDELFDSDTDSESDAELSGVIQDGTELKQLTASIKNTVTCLFRLSMAIRDPAPNSQSRSTIRVDKSIYEEHDILHVQAKFSIGSSFLTDRLGRAVSGRRQYLTYREEHHQKLAKNVEKIGFEEPRTEHTNNSTEASLVPKTTVTPNDALDDDEDALSQTSYASSVNASIRVPPLPKEAQEKEHFECPLCFMIVCIHTTAAWKQHVYRDLHPYCCTFEHCTTADRLYDSRHAWFRHELEAHRTSWQCIEECEMTFQSEEEFAAHVQAYHPEISSSAMFSALKRTSVKRASLSEQAKCPLCEKQMTLRVLQNHLGHHQEQLALFALPPILDATEDDPQDEDQDPVNVDQWQDEEDLSDVSDVDAEKAEDTPNENLVMRVRDLTDDETFVLAEYEAHATKCSHCVDALDTFRNGDSLCDRGQWLASDVAKYFFSKNGKTFSAVDKDRNEEILVRIPRDFKASRRLLLAIEEGLRTDLPVEILERAPRTGRRNIIVYPRSAPSRAPPSRGSLYEADLADRTDRADRQERSYYR